MCELLVGLPDVTVLGLDSEGGAPLSIHVEKLLGLLRAGARQQTRVSASARVT